MQTFLFFLLFSFKVLKFFCFWSYSSVSLIFLIFFLLKTNKFFRTFWKHALNCSHDFMFLHIRRGVAKSFSSKFCFYFLNKVSFSLVEELTDSRFFGLKITQSTIDWIVIITFYLPSEQSLSLSPNYRFLRLFVSIWNFFSFIFR